MTEPAWKVRIDAAQDDLRDAEQALAAAKTRRDASREAVTAAVRAARPTECEATQEEFLRALRPLYWEDPSVGGAALATAAGFRSPAELARAVGSVPSGVPCAICGKDIPRTSRSSSTHESVRPGGALCVDCEERSRSEGTRLGGIGTLRKQYVDTSPVSAAAWEWEVAARLITAYPPVATNVERDSPRDEYDGTWQRQKWAESLELRVLEKARDAMVTVPVWLAQDIIPAAHAAAGWDVTRTRELIDSVTDEAALAVLARLDSRIRTIVAERTAKAKEVYADDYEPSYEEVRRVYEEHDARFGR